MELTITILSGVLGGLILNIMPCVFPVLFFKLGSLVEHAKAGPASLRRDAIGYLAGTWLTFLVFAVLLISLKEAGRAVGWGMQMQQPGFVALVVAMLFAFGLNALGVFQIAVSLSGGRTAGGWWSAMLDGVFITLASTPCSAPFLGGAAAIALAIETPWWETVAIFLAVGFGLALPVLLIGFVPALQRLMPRPGPWMEHAKLIIAITLFAAAIWFMETLQKQTTPEGVSQFLYFLLILGVGLHLTERLRSADGPRRVLGRLAVVSTVVLSGTWLLQFDAPRPLAAPADAEILASSVVEDKLVWTPFTEATKARALAAGRPVFVDFTADWCATCKVFERTHIDIPAVRAVFAETNVLAAKADLTADESLWDALGALGRNGLPTYVIYTPDGGKTLFPEGPPLALAEHLRAAAERFPPPAP